MLLGQVFSHTINYSRKYFLKKLWFFRALKEETGISWGVTVMLMSHTNMCHLSQFSCTAFLLSWQPFFLVYCFKLFFTMSFTFQTKPWPETYTQHWKWDVKRFQTLPTSYSTVTNNFDQFPQQVHTLQYLILLVLLVLVICVCHIIALFHLRYVKVCF